MNSEEFAQWENDAKRALEPRYAAEEIEVILAWFRNIKGEDERELIGNAEVEAMLVFTGARENFDLYNCLMARLFIYAPLILREHGAVASFEAFNKLMEDLGWLALKVVDFPGGSARVRASRELERIHRACKNLVAAGKGKVQTSEADFQRLVTKFCDGACRPTDTIYAGDLQYIWLEKDRLRQAYKEALDAVTAAQPSCI